MKTKLLIIGLTLLIVINIAALTTIIISRWHFSKRIEHWKRPEQHFEHLKKELTLTEEQTEEFKDDVDKLRKEIHVILDSIRTKREMVVSSIAKDNVDREEVYRIIEEIGEDQVKIQKMVIDHIFNEKSTLTPEQRKKFAVLMKEVIFGEKPPMFNRDNRDFTKKRYDVKKPDLKNPDKSRRFQKHDKD
ncbi:periplasmic heavy metal sensor [bacterium]|nr:periplasmic heavy metal sensor [bacterium]